MSNFLDKFNEDEKRIIDEKVTVLAQLMQNWASQYPAFVRPIRIPPLALNTVIMAPYLEIPESLILAKLILWIFGIDDIGDEKRVPLTDFWRKSGQWIMIADGNLNVIDNSADMLSLKEICDSLAEYELFQSLWEYWTRHLRLLVHGMAMEYEYAEQYSRCGKLPLLDELLVHTKYTIGFPIAAVTSSILSDDCSILENIEAVDLAIQNAGIAIRLYNDFRSREKEVAEGTVNTIIVAREMLGADGDFASAERYILSLADDYTRKSFSDSNLKTVTGQMKETIHCAVDFSAFFYAQYDYHTSSLKQIWARERNS